MRAYADDFQNLIDAQVLLPEFFDVGNAVGALVGDVIFRTSVLIRPKSISGLVYVAFDDTGRYEYESHQEAVEKSIEKIQDLIYAHMSKYGLDKSAVQIDIKREEVQAGYLTQHPLEIRLYGVGSGTPRKTIGHILPDAKEPKNI
jgi:N-methylhydantoinase A/oxoprolinase/acetone carboxylase beta subunit